MSDLIELTVVTVMGFLVTITVDDLRVMGVWSDEQTGCLLHMSDIMDIIEIYGLYCVYVSNETLGICGLYGVYDDI